MRRTGWMTMIAVAWASPVMAAEDELVLAVEPAYALLTGEAADRHGAGVGASAWIGLSDELWLAFSAGAGRVGGVEAEMLGSEDFFEFFGGLVAALDVFRTIPFVEAQIGMAATDASLSPTIRFGVGADYFVSRTISVGAVARFRPVDEDIGGSIFTMALRLSWRIEL